MNLYQTWNTPQKALYAQRECRVRFYPHPLLMTKPKPSEIYSKLSAIWAPLILRLTLLYFFVCFWLFIVFSLTSTIQVSVYAPAFREYAEFTHIPRTLVHILGFTISKPIFSHHLHLVFSLFFGLIFLHPVQAILISTGVLLSSRELGVIKSTSGTIYID